MYRTPQEEETCPIRVIMMILSSRHDLSLQNDENHHDLCPLLNRTVITSIPFTNFLLKKKSFSFTVVLQHGHGTTCISVAEVVLFDSFPGFCCCSDCLSDWCLNFVMHLMGGQVSIKMPHSICKVTFNFLKYSIREKLLSHRHGGQFESFTK
jgi:hypothetical protein